MKKRILIIIGIILIILIGSIYIYKSYKSYKSTDDIFINDVAIVNEDIEEIVEEETFKVDIKGAVETPGVYSVRPGSIVQDLIDLAGGLTKNAYTKNINLSKELSKEMVIYIYTNSEIKKLEVANDAICKTEVIEITNSGDASSVAKKTTTTTATSSKVNINTASLSELMTLNGVGESKAQAIIEYRQIKRFESIEEIQNVSGIGESLYAKIKEFITIN